MKRGTLLLAILALALLSGRGAPLAPTAPDTGLPPVSAGPPGSDEALLASFDGAREAERLAERRRIHAEIRWRHTGLSGPEVWEVAETIVAESENHGVDPSLVLAVIQVESGGYAFAVSRVGALGLMQIMPYTGESLCKQLGVPWNGPDTLFDPVVNVKLGVAYLRELADRYNGSWELALLAYNWGPARIDSKLRRGVRLPSLYVEQVRAVYVPGETPAARS